MIDINPAKLLCSKRGDVVDEEYFGFVFLFENSSLIKKYGDDNCALFYLRSLSKPVQASLIQDFNAVEKLNLTQEEVAICCGSHSGTNKHVSLVDTILNKAGLDECQLLCPPATPLDTKDFDGNKKPICHNCSAKHTLMLALSKLNGWNLSNYTDVNHPLQKLIYERHIELSGALKAEISYDGCGTPVFALRVNEIARMFFNLFANYPFILNAMVNNPYIIGGLDRLDSEIIQLGEKNLVAKVGAGGFLLVYNIKEGKILIVKMSQNNNLPRRIVALNVLYKLGWIKQNPAPEHFSNDLGKVVGHYFCFVI